MARGGPVLAPGPRELPLQYIDVRDLATWVLDAAQAGLSGPYTLISPSGHTSMGRLLDACVQVTGGDADLRWTAPEVITAAGIEPWMQLPVWVPPGGDMHAALHSADVAKAVAAGLRSPARRGDRRRHLGLAAVHRRDGTPAPGPPGARPRPGDGGQGTGDLRAGA